MLVIYIYIYIYIHIYIYIYIYPAVLLVQGRDVRYQEPRAGAVGGSGDGGCLKDRSNMPTVYNRSTHINVSHMLCKERGGARERGYLLYIICYYM